MQEAAKEQITTLTTLFTGGYFALISIGDINGFKAAVSKLSSPGIAAILIFLPMLFSLVSLAFANVLYLSKFNDLVLTFSKRLDTSGNIDYTETMRHLLGISIWAMFLGLFILLVDLGLYLL
jgi:hypothetical protein